MKCVLFAGGPGIRHRGETLFRPKPMVPVGGKLNLWHIMKTFVLYGYKDFIFCTGYHEENFRQYFQDFESMNSNFRVKIGSRQGTTRRLE